MDEAIGRSLGNVSLEKDLKSTIHKSTRRARRIQCIMHIFGQKVFLIQLIKGFMFQGWCCILLVLLLLTSMVLLKYSSFLPMIHFLNFVRFFHLQFFLIIILPISFVIFFHHSSTLKDYSFKDTLSFVSQFKNANLSGKVHVSYDVTSLFTNISLEETIDIVVNLIFSHNPNLSITIKKLEKTFSFSYITDSFSF